MTAFNTEGVALITGAAHGIGRASALALAASGSDVAVIDRDAETLEKLAKNITSVGRRVLAITADCTDGAALEKAVADVESKLGAITTLFNNVGQSARERSGPFARSSQETWRLVLEVSLLSAMQMSRLVVPGMQTRGCGRIINMSSDAAFCGDAGLAEYTAAKMGIVGFSRTLARELAPDGIGVNVVAPGAIRTRAHDTLPGEVLERIRQNIPLGYVAEPDDVANVVVFLASPASRYITGQTLLIDGGRWMI